MSDTRRPHTCVISYINIVEIGKGSLDDVKLVAKLIERLELLREPQDPFGFSFEGHEMYEFVYLKQVLIVNGGEMVVGDLVDATDPVARKTVSPSTEAMLMFLTR